jgi:hypothetical protein
MPRYVNIIDFRAEGVTSGEEADLLRSFFAAAHAHTDETLEQALHQLLEEMPAVRLHVLTESEDLLGAGSVLDITATDARREPVDPIRDGTPGVDAFYARPPLPTDLAYRSDWERRLTSGTEKKRLAAIRAASSVVRGSAMQKERRAERDALLGPLGRALATDRLDDPLRAELWSVASWADVPAMHERVLEAMKANDPTLTDDLVERQRELVMKVLPHATGVALAEADDRPWVSRAVAILERWGLAPSGERGRALEAARHVEKALAALDSCTDRRLRAVAAALQAQHRALCACTC